MAKSAPTKIRLSKICFEVTIPKEVREDPSFPFKVNQEVQVIINGKELIIRAENGDKK